MAMNMALGFLFSKKTVHRDGVQGVDHCPRITTAQRHLAITDRLGPTHAPGSMVARIKIRVADAQMLADRYLDGRNPSVTPRRVSAELARSAVQG
jgi:hypothetical protein